MPSDVREDNELGNEGFDLLNDRDTSFTSSFYYSRRPVISRNTMRGREMYTSRCLQDVPQRAQCGASQQT